MTQLDTLIIEHRGMARADLLISRLVARQPPTTLDGYSGVLHVEDGAAVGMTLNGRLLKFLGHPEGYGSDFPWRRAFWRLRHECRRNHPYHAGGDVPYWRGSLCQELVRLVIMGPERTIAGIADGPLTIHQASQILRYDNPEPVLREALEFIGESIATAHRHAIEKDRQLEAAVRPVNAPAEHRERHDQPGMHRLDCPQCRKSGAA